MKIKTFVWIIALQVLCTGLTSGAEPKFIFIAGGSASGKTTFAKTLVKKLGDDQAFYLSLDEYLDKRIQPENDFIEGIPNFDNPSMINWKLLSEHFTNLQNGLSIEAPIYDFSTWGPVGVRTMPWKSIVIIEGIHATQNNVDSIDGLRVFIDVNEDLRYKRRIVRDVKERNYSIELIEKTFFKMSVPFQKIFLDPTRYKANIIVENLDGEDYLEKAISYVVSTLRTFEPIDYKNLRFKMMYQEGNLVIE